MTPTWTQVLVRRSYFSMVVEPGVTYAVKHFRGANAGEWTTAVGRCHTFGGVHPSYGVQCAHRGLSGFGPRALEHGAPLGQKMVLHGLHQQLLAFQVIGEHLVVFQIGEELQIQVRHHEKTQISGGFLQLVLLLLTATPPDYTPSLLLFTLYNSQNSEK